ncbi:MAG TPA: rhomboid family intramembrane serine protease [Polyangiaceae bacterium]
MSAAAEKTSEESVRAKIASAEEPVSAFADAPFMRAMFVLNIVVFVAEVLYAASLPSPTGAPFVMRLLKALLDIPSSVGLTFGANYASATLYDGRIDTLLACCFLHGSFVHITFNLIVLRAIGPFLERIVGTGRTAVLYVGAGIVSSMFSTLEGWWWQQERVGVGASGAICGLIGAAFVVGYRTAGKNSPLVRLTTGWMTTILFFGLAVTLSKLGNFDNAAHVGGALSGAAIALLWQRGAEQPFRRTLGIGLAAGLIVATIAGVAVRDARDPFVAMLWPERVQAADLALRKGDCDGAWSAALSAVRIARRDPQALHAITVVRSACGIPNSA